MLAIAGSAGAFVAGAGLCATYIGCAVGAPMMGASADVGAAHVTSLVTGSAPRTLIGEYLGPGAQFVEEAGVAGVGLADAVIVTRGAAAAGSTLGASRDYVNPASPERTEHILIGDSRGGGGHQWPGNPGKTLFPRSWSGEEIMHHISDIATDPTLTWTRQGGGPWALFTRAGNPTRFFVIGIRNGVRIKVIIEPAGEGIITAFPW